MAEEIRAFLALEIPESVKAVLAAARDPVRVELPRARWVRLESQHLTLKFLGDVQKPVLSALAADLRPRLAGSGAVTVRLGGSGFFPSPTRPRVAWLGGTAEGIEPVVRAVEEVAASHGFARERRPWSLHVTQARLDRPWPPAAVERFLGWGRGLDPASFVCTEAVLFASRLQPGGAVYTPVERIPLT